MGDRPYPNRPKVLYIGGTGRTGSTLLTRLLGQIPGWFAGGELAFLWNFGIGAGGRCSCGTSVVECPFWSVVIADVEGGGLSMDPGRMVALRRRCRSVHLPPMLASRHLADHYMNRLEEFPDVAAATYRAIASHSKARVVIDSSKEPLYSWILRERTDLDVFFLQLVRDPRAVAHSWSRRRTELGLGKSASMSTRGPMKSSIYYDVSNAAAERIWGSRPDRVRFLRYEDLIARPEETLAAIGAFVGDEFTNSALRGRAFEATEQHIAWGNPNRFDAGTIELRQDDAWKTAQGRLAATIAWLATAPLAYRYGYPARASRPMGPLRSARLSARLLIEAP